MPKLTKICPYCSEPAVEKESFTLDNEVFSSLTCGHTLVETISRIEEAKKASFSSIKGDTPYPYQLEGIEFAEGSLFRCLIADEMGLGKTIQALGILKLHPELLPALIVVKSSLRLQWMNEVINWCGIDYLPQIIEGGKDEPSPFFPVTIVSMDTLPKCKWLGSFAFKTLIIDECQGIKNPEAKRSQAIRNLAAGRVLRKRELKGELRERAKIEVMARDLMKWFDVADRFSLNFERLGESKLGVTECKSAGNGEVEGRITLDINHALEDKEDDILDTILHEIAHAITPGAGHKPIWSQVCKDIGGDGQAKAWCSGSEVFAEEIDAPRNIIALSGTPIKNHAGEYFTILNILKPEKFTSLKSFYWNWVDTYTVPAGRGQFKTKVGGIKQHKVEAFKDYTKDFILRRTRAEVLPDLPKIRRSFQAVEIAEEVSQAYKRVMVEFTREYDEEGVTDKNMMNMLAYMARMRHLTGLSKIEPLTDHVLDFLKSTDRKIVIFHHHKDVGELLKLKLEKAISEDEDFAEKPKIIHTTSEQDKTYQFSLEEEFRTNPLARVLIASTIASGEGKNWQFCSDAIMSERQWNPANEEQAEGRFSRIGSEASSINVTYFTCLNSIDEYFTELVEGKRKAIHATLNHEVLGLQEQVLMRELAEILANKGRKAWQI